MAVVEPAKICLPPPATLFSVPPSLLDTICAETDTKGLLSLARTCKALNPVAEARLLRHVNIRLDPRIADVTDDILDRGHDERWDRLKGLLVALQSEPRRIRYIRSLRVTLWIHSIKDLSKLLVLVSGSVQSLYINDMYLWRQGEDWGRLATEILSCPQRPLFASVRDLDMSCPIDILAKLLHLMPKVESIRLAEYDTLEEEEEPDWPEMSGLRRFSIGSCNLESIVPFLKRCPALEDLHLDGSTPHGLALDKQRQWLIDNLLPLPRVSRLVLFYQPVAIFAQLASHHLPALQDLQANHVVKCPAACRLEFIPIPDELHRLKILRLCLRLPGYALCYLKNRPTSSLGVRLGGSIPQKLIEDINSAPSLEFVRLYMRTFFAPDSVSTEDEDEDEDETWCGAFIDTLVYGAQTVYVIHSRTTSRSVPYRLGMEDDEQCVCYPVDAPLGEVTTWYQSTNPVEEIQTDFLGELVPLEIIDAMARIDGVERWRGRGVQVSTRAWQVLLDWYAQLVAGRG